MAQWPEGYGRVVLDEVDSTLSEAARQAPQLAGPMWILAHAQTAARGRRGRAWSTPRGNFAATLVMRHKGSPAQAAQRSFVSSLALYRALSRLAPGRDFQLKWPNDVLLDGKKLAGILLESSGDCVMIGIGVNLVHLPETQMLEPGALAPVALSDVAPEQLLDVLAQEYAALEAQFRRDGFAPIRLGWLAHAARLGEQITARSMREETVGIFEDVDEAGNLILRSPQGRVVITAADVFF
ncbi:MAG: biotin--[acetyl-CoA-carboxylase] ligase [Sulfitobacter sp.]